MNPVTYLMSDDNGIFVQCERLECCSPNGRWYFQGETLPPKLTAEQATAFIDDHLETH